MIKKLRRKFVLICVSLVFGVLLVLGAVSNFSSYLQINRQTKEILDILCENDGAFPKIVNFRQMISPEIPFSTRYFSVVLDNDGTIDDVNVNSMQTISTEEAVKYAQKVMLSGKTHGTMNQFKYKVAEYGEGYLMVFVDASYDVQTFRFVFINSIWVSALCLIIVFLLAVYFSKEAIRPISESYEKQKRFITDVSHELKTPLAIIRTNTEVLDMYYNENEWTKSIQNNAIRLSQLVESLVTLTRMDEENMKLQMILFSISDAVIESSEQFLAFATKQNVQIKTNVESQISYCGNEHSIRQIVCIFLDNAIKYATTDSEIKLTLKRQGKKTLLTVSNETENLAKGNCDILFERFYRADKSRNSQTGGYGIGLSIAKAIVLQHKGKISAQSPDGKTFVISVML